MSLARPVGLLLGYLADLLLGDPRRHHPVAGFGALVRGTEALLYADRRAAGVAHAALLVGGPVAAGLAADRATVGRPVLRAGVTALATWTVLGGRSLRREATLVHRRLADRDVPAAREQVTHLVGRDPAGLDAAGVARATVESVAENTSDAAVAPLLWGAVGGTAGLLGYRAANTLDAMVGHRSDRYARYGWASARLDDLLNLVPARLSALLAAAAAPVVGGRPSAALAAWRHDARRHPSPNAGPVEAAFAGALGVTLGGRNRYGGVTEDRGTLGSGPAPDAPDIQRAVRLSRWVAGSAVIVTAASAARPRRR